MPVPPARPRTGLAMTLAVALAAVAALVTAPAASAATEPASRLLARLPVVAEPTQPYYDRSSFPFWAREDGDPCDARYDVLTAESIEPRTTFVRCEARGVWTSYYDGATTDDVTTLTVDHLVPPGEAWRSGAWAWSAAQRAAFFDDTAYDPSLVAVTTSSTWTKLDDDPTRWLPPAPGARCRYASEWVGVKHRWHLAVDPAERATLADLIAGCGDPAVEVPARADVPDVPPPPGPGLPAATGSTMRGGQQLPAGSWLLSPDRSHGLTFQADGNVVAYGPDYRPLWSSHTYGNPGSTFVMQADGNAVVYALGGRAIWSSRTYRSPGATLRVQDDGDVVISSGSRAVFSTGRDRTSLVPGDSITTGQQITSASGRYHLILQGDGNVVTYTASGRPLFFTGSYGADRLTLQADGNLVATRAGQAVWDAGTWREGRLRLDVQDDGNAVLYRPGGSPAWYSAFDTGAAATSPGRGTPLPAAAHHASCAAARAAGAAPLYRGRPGYRPGLDADGDGIACER